MSVQQIVHQVLDKIRIHDDIDGRPINRWTNPDILPVLPKIEPSRPKPMSATGYPEPSAPPFWSMGSSAIANGLTAGQAIGAMLVGGVISAIIAWLCGKPGIKYHLGFPMMSRVTFGMFGSYFIVVLKCFTNFLYCGIQTYWGGLAVHVILAAIFPSFHRMKNTLPASANITTADLTGTIIYMCCFVPLLLIKPYKLHKFFMFSFFGVIATILGMFIWAMAANHGAGDLVAPAKKLSTGDRAFVFIQAICTVCGSFTGSSIRHSDWSRYAKTPKSPLLGIWLAGPLALTLTAMFGVFVTSAARAMYGQILWQPLSLLLYIQKTSYTPGVRAGTFFAGLGWFLSQLAVNISLNSVAAGMDLTSVLPAYLSAKRGGLLLAFVGFVCCPWNFVNSPGTFVTVLSSFGLFVSPLIGIYVADFWVVRKCNWRVPDLYIGDNRSVYWYTGGWHWRGFVCWLGIIWLSLPGFVTAVRGTKIALAWTRIFQITFFVGLFGGFITYTALCFISPVPHAGEHEDYDWASDPASLGSSEKESDVEVREKDVGA